MNLDPFAAREGVVDRPARARPAAGVRGDGSPLGRALSLADRPQLRRPRPGQSHVLKLADERRCGGAVVPCDRCRPVPRRSETSRSHEAVPQRARALVRAPPALVQDGGLLRDPHAGVLRLQRRRLGRLPRAPAEARLPPVARHRLHLAAARSTPRRCATAATTSPTSTAINPDYGDVEDFRAFVEAAHERGIRVIADLVMNHTSPTTRGSRSRATTRTGRRPTGTSGRTRTTATWTRGSSSSTPRRRTGRWTRCAASTTGTASSTTSRT